jgi:acid phosphatase
MRLALVTAALLALALPAVAAPPAVPRLDHVVVVVFENKERGAVLGSGAAPTFDRLARTGADLQQHFAVTHPSLPNYLALVSGSTQRITDDCTRCVANGRSIGDLLTARKRAWAGYAEGYPHSPRFAKKHMPFLYFPRDAGRVKPLAALDPLRLPAFAFVAPDLCNGMHDCDVATGDRWLARHIGPLLAVARTAVFVVFDEGTTNEHGGGHVVALVAGSAVRPARVTATTTHYTLLRTIEDALGLPHLGASAGTRPLQGIWR